jgi:hypothetical protein
MGNLRKMMASLSVVAILSTLVVSTAAFAAEWEGFTDVSGQCETDANYLGELGLVTQRDNFNGSTAPTRAEMVKLAMVSAGYVPSSVAAVDPMLDLYSDVPTSHWFYSEGYSTVSYHEGIATGYSPKPVVTDGAVAAQGTFGPDDASTVAQQAKILIVTAGGEFDEDVADGEAFYANELDALTALFGNADPESEGSRCAVTAVVADDVREMNGDEEEDDEDEDVEVGGLWIEVSDMSPDASGKIPNGSLYTSTVWSMTATDGDTKVTSITVDKNGAGDEAEIAALVLKDAEGNRLSKVKTSINSDDEATLTMLDGGYNIMDGDTLEVYLVVQAGVAAGNVGDHSFGIADVDAVSANGTVTGDFPAYGDTFEYIDSDGPTVVVSEDSDVADVKVGEQAAIISSFSVESDGDDDIWFNRITLRDNGSASLDEAVGSPMLLHGGDEVATCTIDDEYISCDLDESVEIEEGNTEDFEIVGDIMSEAGRTLELYLDNAIDFEGVSDDGFGAGATNNLDTTDIDAFDIEAGEVTIVEGEHPDKTRKDKDNVVAAVMYITAAGSDTDAVLEFEAFNATLDVTGGATVVDDLVENIELYDVTSGSTYDLTVTGGATTSLATIYDRDLGIYLTPGVEYEFQVRFDTLDDDAVNANAFTVATTSIGDGTTTDGLEFKEPADDEYATDVTPSAITFETVDGEASTVDLNFKPLSDDTAVVGSEGVLLLEFEVEETSGVSTVDIDSLSVTDRGAGDNNLTSDYVSQLKLYTVVDDVETLVKTKSGSQATGDEITFNNLEETVDADGELTFRVYADFVDDDTNDGDDLQLRLLDYDFEDDENDAVLVALDVAGNSDGTLDDGEVAGEVSGRLVTLAGTGILYVTVDNNDVAVDQSKWLLAGASSDFVASYELRSENEVIIVEDFRLTAAGTTVFENLVDEVVVYGDDMVTEIARKSVSDGSVDFSNVDIEIEESAENWYVALDLNLYGKDEIGVVGEDGITFDLSIIDSLGDASAKGDSSKDNLLAGNEDGTVDSGEIVYDGGGNGDFDEFFNFDADSGESLGFGVLASMISDVELVSSYSGTTLASTLTNGSNNVAIIKVTTSSSSNTEQDGTDIVTYLDDISIDVSADSGAAGLLVDMFTNDDFTLERINGSSGAEVVEEGSDLNGSIVNISGGTLVFDVNSDDLDPGQADNDDMGVDAELDPGTTAYYLVKAFVSDLNGETNGYGYIQVDLDDLDGDADPNFVFSDFESSLNELDALRLDYDDLDGIKINES